MPRDLGKLRTIEIMASIDAGKATASERVFLCYTVKIDRFA